MKNSQHAARLLAMVAIGLLLTLSTSCTTTGPDSSEAAGTSGSSFKETKEAERKKLPYKPYPFDHCAVIRKDLEGNPKHRRIYDGHEVLFCCTPCVKAFDTTPEAFMPRIRAAAQ